MDFLLELARIEGWNPGLSDASAFYHTDPKGFFIGKLDNQPVGCISAVAYNDDYGFLGFYIVVPEQRNKGYGIQLWRKAMAYLGERTVGLDGVIEQQENYKKSGFQFFYNNIRFKGKVQRQYGDNELIPIDKIPFQTIVDFDTSVFGINRAQFLQNWFRIPRAKGFAKIENSKCVGYGWIRPCSTGYKIGPLFADCVATARNIFTALSGECDNADIILDIPETNIAAMQSAREYQLDIVFRTARMYKGTPPRQDLKKVFGVTTFELG